MLFVLANLPPNAKGCGVSGAATPVPAVVERAVAGGAEGRVSPLG